MAEGDMKQVAMVPSLVQVQGDVRLLRRVVENTPGANQPHENPELKAMVRFLDYLAAHVGALYEALPIDARPSIFDVQKAYDRGR